MTAPIFVSAFFIDYILPFVLVFTLIFAILEKTQLLGEGKKQINAIMGLVIGIILIAFPFARNIVVQLMPFLVVVAVVLFVFMLLYGFMGRKKNEEILSNGLKITLGIIIGLALVTAILFISGYWDAVYDLMFGGEGAGQIWINILLIGVMVGAIISVLKGEEKEKT